MKKHFIEKYNDKIEELWQKSPKAAVWMSYITVGKACTDSFGSYYHDIRIKHTQTIGGSTIYWPKQPSYHTTYDGSGGYSHGTCDNNSYLTYDGSYYKSCYVEIGGSMKCEGAWGQYANHGSDMKFYIQEYDGGYRPADGTTITIPFAVYYTGTPDQRYTMSLKRNCNGGWSVKESEECFNASASLSFTDKTGQANAAADVGMSSCTKWELSDSEQSYELSVIVRSYGKNSLFNDLSEIEQEMFVQQMSSSGDLLDLESDREDGNAIHENGSESIEADNGINDGRILLIDEGTAEDIGGSW